MKHIETERRWLIKFPLASEAEKAIEEEHDVPARIEQTYLKSDDDTVHRVRRVDYSFWNIKQPAHYISTTKKFIELGINEEDEQALDEIGYQRRLLDRDPNHIEIEKTRYHLHYRGRLFELDIFDGSHKGLAILELEIPAADWEEKIELPPYLEIIREITHESGWSNWELSLRKMDKSSWYQNIISFLMGKNRNQNELTS